MTKNSSYPKVAVVILCYNGIEFSKAFLPSLINSKYPNLEIIVADNNSTDGTVEFVKENYPSITIIEIAENEGFAGGYNTALSQVKADYYVLLNQDVEVTDNWIEPIIHVMEADYNLAAAQPKILAQKQKEYFEHAGAAGGFIDFLGYPFCRGRIFDTLEKDENQYDETINCFWASGAATFIKAKAYNSIGGLDVDFFAHMEEIDLCWRLQLAGYTIKCIPASTVYHVGGGVLPYKSSKKAYLNYRNNLIMLHKNLSANRLIAVLTIRFLLDVVSAYRELFRGNFKIYYAIAKAHLHYIRDFFKIHKKRTANLNLIQSIKIGNSNLKSIYKKSIVWKHFIKKIDTYDKL